LGAASREIRTSAIPPSRSTPPPTSAASRFTLARAIESMVPDARNPTMTSSSILVVHEEEIRALLDPASCIAAVEQAFALYAAGAAELPNVIHLDVPEYRGEVHVKAGYLHGGEFYAVKMASGFPGNPSIGLSPGNGLVVVFDARTGAPHAILLDNGYITDLRTAAAGAAAVKRLARESVDTVAVVGTGLQARLQVRLLASVRSFRTVRVWGRRPEATA
jgi:ornithine cyclodeaminase